MAPERGLPSGVSVSCRYIPEPLKNPARNIFPVTGLECVYLTVLEPNTGAITAYEHAGFRRQGLHRNSNKWLGRRVNEIHMDAVPAEFPGPSRVKQQFGADP